MNLKIKKVAESYPALAYLVLLDKQKKIELRSAVKIRLAENIRQIKPHFDKYQNEMNDLIEKYGALNTDGAFEVKKNLISKGENDAQQVIANPKWADFVRERDEMDSVEVNVGITPIKYTDLFQPKPDSITGAITEQQIDIDTLVLLQEINLLEN